MLFSEVYGTYYNVLAQLLTEAAAGNLTKESMYRIVREKGFEESVLTIPEALQRQTWPLITGDYSTPLTHSPTRPLTTLQKRWLKALLSDPRIQLFDPPTEGLGDVEPLYPPDTFVYYDRYNDGDPYGDPGYIARFRCILSGIRQKRWIRIQFTGRNGVLHDWRCVPYRLEYSSKDDKFRLICANKRTTLSINLARITQCFLLEDGLISEEVFQIAFEAAFLHEQEADVWALEKEHRQTQKKKKPFLDFFRKRKEKEELS